MPAHIWFGLLAPARTPEPIIAKLNAAVNEGLKIPEMQVSIAKLGMETRSFTAQEFADKLVEEERAWAAAIRESGITRARRAVRVNVEDAQLCGKYTRSMNGAFNTEDRQGLRLRRR